MIYVKLMGGLGNQMFQYAIGRKLAVLHDTTLVLDTSFLESKQLNCTARKYELNQLSIVASTATTQEICFSQYSEIGGVGLWLAKLKKRLGIELDIPNLIKERGFPYNENILSVKDNCYLHGYWQSEKYFLDIREQLVSEFQPNAPLSGKNKLVADQMIGCEAVSVHIRRGDYLSDSKTAEVHGHCSIDYYQHAFDIIKDSVVNPHFYFFSDDIDWVKNNFKINGDATYIDHNSDCGYEDIRLMSMCRHHIVANSSFSWWGAWLGKNPEKIVLAPGKWFKTNDLDTRDLLPVNWRSLDVIS